uniref:pre-rRNA-processing protein TSR2 homolog n=1 Tax=Erigeron canadensis TaxID=72917 RepID=UPI001CB8B0BE|nr:pre-rRNA-processing protein TSR2 homolog [Erigeron canadensis]
MVVPTQRTGEAENQLREGIDMLLGQWSALQMAIENEWGGRDTRQRAQQLAVDIYHRLIRPAETTLYVDDLDNLLDDFMLSLNTEVDDGSIEDISDKLMIMHEEYLEGKFVSIERLRQSTPAANHRMQVVNGGEDSTSSSEDESMEMEEELDI